MNQGHFGVPGQTAAVFTQENEFLWGGDESRIPVLRKSIVVDGTARDAGNTPTTVLRQGLLLGKVTATGKHKQWDASAVDGTEDVAGILPVELVMTDQLGVDQDRVCPLIVFAPIKARNLLIEGAALVGHADEAAARTSLNAKRFMLDDEY